MRISDWSSDVCSSDLILEAPVATTGQVAKAGFGAFLYLEVLDASFSFDGVIGAFALSNNLFIIAIGLGIGAMFVRSMTIFLVKQGTLRSEEHTSELQSLMRISYAVFCLKKKKQVEQL